MKELKCLKHWISKTNLRFEERSLKRMMKSYFALLGYGRYWRIWFDYAQNKLIIEVSRKYKNFERWRNNIELTKFIPLSVIKDKNIFNEKNFIIFINEMNKEVKRK